jgi:hypothetical protein
LRYIGEIPTKGNNKKRSTGHFEYTKHQKKVLTGEEGNARMFPVKLNNQQQTKIMSQQQQLTLRCACADLIGAMEARNNNDIESHDWNAHLMTINDLIKAYPFLNDFKPQMQELNLQPT